VPCGIAKTVMCKALLCCLEWGCSWSPDAGDQVGVNGWVRRKEGQGWFEVSVPVARALLHIFCTTLFVNVEGFNYMNRQKQEVFLGRAVSSKSCLHTINCCEICLFFPSWFLVVVVTEL